MLFRGSRQGDRAEGGSQAVCGRLCGLFPVFALVSLVGCATMPDTALSSNEGADEPPAPAASAEPTERPALDDVLYKLLVAEFAGRRGQLSLALQNYLEVARETGDAGAAERAVRIAVFSRDSEGGIEAARLWVETAPDSADAKQVYAALLTQAGRRDEAVEVLRELLAQLEAESPGSGYAKVADVLARDKDKDAAIATMEGLVAGHEDDPRAQFALGHLLARAGQLERAAAVFARVMELEPDNEQAVVFYARLLQREGDTEGAMKSLADALEKRPDAHVVRLTYARLLVDAKRYDEARAQFERLADETPENEDVRYALGLLLLQTNRLDDAREQFERLLDSQQRRQAALYYLGQIAENQKRIDDALDNYRHVDHGEHRLDAQIRVAVLMAEREQIERARAHLHGLRGSNRQESIRLFRAEAEILVRHDQLDDALVVYNRSLDEFPSDGELLYGRAMLAEKLDRLDLLESDLREILSREPDNADALNALGYTLADRTDRLDEAQELIQRAYELKPDDHYIVDSMGWVMYRMGRYQEALTHLRRAMELSPDPEIAAHLGEVLWVTGDKDAARAVWDTALESTPDDKRLLDVKRRFGL